MVELLNAGADPNLANNKGDVPLMCACQKNMCSGVATLLASGARIEQTDPRVNSPVMVCCRVGHDVILETLLSKLLKEPNGQDKLRNQLALCAKIDGFNPLMASAEQNHWKCIKVLHNYKADLEAKTATDNKIMPCGTSLHIAVYYGCVEAALALLEVGANPNQRDLLGRTPLHIAVLQSNCVMVSLLKSFRVDFTVRDNAGHVASFYASTQEVKFELDEPSLKYLLQIARSGTLEPTFGEMIKKDTVLPGLLTSADCLDVASGDGWTPLMESVVFGNHNLAIVLVEAGVDVDRTEVHGFSAGFWASLFNRNHLTFFGRELELSRKEIAVLEMMDKLKKSDVRSALLFDIDMNALYQEIQTLSSKQTNESQQERSFLHVAMSYACDKLDSPALLEIPKTRSKCSLGSFMKVTHSEDKTQWLNGERPLANVVLLENLVSAAKYLVSKVDNVVEDEETLGLQELTVLNLLSSSRHVFFSMNSGLVLGGKNWAPFISLALKALDILPPYHGEIYRGISTKFLPQVLHVGRELKWSTFTMCTSSWYELLDKDGTGAGGGGGGGGGNSSTGNEPSFKYNVMFLIRTHRFARSLSSFSSCGTFCPVILLPNSRFVIKSLHVASVIGLGQPEVRGTAYRMTDSYLTQAEKKQKPVFVVLEEMFD
eukprot:TRINITY_DN1827_c1_g1_i2.p1 TRINITY_DN1827_c1_g1~~TRINITY_DN1827_c1_g1_i2.p1  ORF type:complete len:657 (-),score=177.20 TRINITY_DN1827_c1_g1_i2:159-2129(-)